MQPVDVSNAWSIKKKKKGGGGRREGLHINKTKPFKLSKLKWFLVFKNIIGKRIMKPNKVKNTGLYCMYKTTIR